LNSAGASPLGPPSPTGPLAALPVRAALSKRAALRQRLKRQWDQLSLYLPVILMGLLALGSYWVIGRTAAPAEPAAALAPTQGPDTAMHGFLVREFDPAGHLRLQIEGQRLHHYPADGRVAVEQARLYSRAADGQVTRASAQHLLSNADQSIHWLSGEVELLRFAPQADAQAAPEMKLLGQALTLYTAANRIESEQPVDIWRGPHHTRADRLRYDKTTGQLELLGRVRSTLAPTAR